VQAALRGKPPRIFLTDYTTVTERNEQEGVRSWLKGSSRPSGTLPRTNPRLVWKVSGQDALDVLGTLSMIHRRLDSARLAPTNSD
jgi:hypothetical protein